VERFTDLSIIIKSFTFQERDRIAVCLTENHGKITGLAKGGVHSRRFGGSLDFLSCSRVDFVKKPNAELARIDSATAHHEFTNLHRDFERLTVASFAAEFMLKLFESETPSRELFVILSNLLFQLDKGEMPTKLASSAFLCKAFKAMGYPPSLLRCSRCTRGAHEIIFHEADAPFFWSSESGGMICASCADGQLTTSLTGDTLLYFHKLTMTPFKELEWNQEREENSATELYRVLADFLHHHIPGMPAQGLKSWKLLNSF
jgi:DNA repair protein RecO